MSIALVIVCTLLGLIAAGSAMGKLTANPKIVESMHNVGVSDQQIRILAILELLGTAGLVVGIVVPALGIAAAAGLALYFLGAVIAHFRARHAAAEWAPAFVIMLIGVAATILQLQR
jgi:DoxX-like family